MRDNENVNLIFGEIFGRDYRKYEEGNSKGPLGLRFFMGFGIKSQIILFGCNFKVGV